MFGQGYFDGNGKNVLATNCGRSDVTWGGVMIMKKNYETLEMEIKYLN